MSTNESIFEDRTPEAAARQIALVLAQSVEYHLATLDELKEYKRTAKHRIERQESICDKLITHVRDLKIQPEGFFFEKMPRLIERLAEGETT